MTSESLVRSFRRYSDKEIKQILQEINHGNKSPILSRFTKNGASTILRQSFKREEMLNKRLPYEGLDRLTVDSLLGAREQGALKWAYLAQRTEVPPMKYLSLSALIILLVSLSQPSPAQTTSKGTVPTAAHISCFEPEDHYRSSPIILRGKLVVTYVDQTIDKSKGDNYEVGVFDFEHPEAGLKRLTHNLVNESEVVISPDGKKLLYTVRPRLDDFSDPAEIWQINIDGTSPIRLVSGRPMGVPTWNPNGTQFLFIQWGGDTKGSRFFTYDFATREVTPFLPDLRNPADPNFSYDGKLITFKMPVEGDRDFQPSIYVMNADGSNMRRLSRGYSDHDPAFSLDDGKIYFERYYGPGDWFKTAREHNLSETHWWGIVEVDVKTGKEKVVIPYDPCGNHIFWLPTVSPDGKHLMYIYTDIRAQKAGKPSSELWVADTDGKNAQKVRGSDWFYFFDWTK